MPIWVIVFVIVLIFWLSGSLDRIIGPDLESKETRIGPMFFWGTTALALLSVIGLFIYLKYTH